MPRLNDNIFKITWPSFAADKLPSALRVPFWVEWVLALVAPIRRMHAEFLVFRKEILDKTTVNGQRKILEAFLRRTVGGGINVILNDRSVYILLFPDDDARIQSIIKFDNDGDGSIDVHPLYPDRVPAESETDFTVQIPSSFPVADQLKVAALTDSYKTYSTTYDIELI